MAPLYWNKMGKNGEENCLFAITRWHTLHIKWVSTEGGPGVMSCTRQNGRIKDLHGRGYKRMDADLAAEILHAAINDLNLCLPKGR